MLLKNITEYYSGVTCLPGEGTSPHTTPAGLDASPPCRRRSYVRVRLLYTHAIMPRHQRDFHRPPGRRISTVRPPRQVPVAATSRGHDVGSSASSGRLACGTCLSPLWNRNVTALEPLWNLPIADTALARGLLWRGADLDAVSRTVSTQRSNLSRRAVCGSMPSCTDQWRWIAAGLAAGTALASGCRRARPGTATARVRRAQDRRSGEGTEGNRAVAQTDIVVSRQTRSVAVETHIQ